MVLSRHMVALITLVGTVLAVPLVAHAAASLTVQPASRPFGTTTDRDSAVVFTDTPGRFRERSITAQPAKDGPGEYRPVVTTPGVRVRATGTSTSTGAGTDARSATPTRTSKAPPETGGRLLVLAGVGWIGLVLALLYLHCLRGRSRR